MAQFDEGDFEGIEDYRDLAGVSLSLIALTAKTYLEAGHADPLIYKMVGRATELSELLGVQEFTDKLALLKLEVGNKVEEIIEEHEMPIGREDWS